MRQRGNSSRSLESRLWTLAVVIAAAAGTAAGFASPAPASHRAAPGQNQRSPRSAAYLRVAQLFIGEISRTDTGSTPGDASTMPTLETYWKAMDQVQNDFYNPDVAGTPNSTNLTYAAIRGVLGSLDDPYTRFLSPQQYADMQNENRGTFPGVGIELRAAQGGVEVDQVVPDSPAAAAPLLPGDQVVSVGSTSVSGMTTEQVGSLLKGEDGTRVTFSILRAGKVLTFTLVRRQVSYPHFESRIIDGDVGYMHLLMFDEHAAANIQKALRGFQQQGVRGIILDLRDNPGGLLNAAVDVASEFIPHGPVVWVQERGGQRNSLLTTDAFGKTRRLPLVVLVNHSSASASEIVSGAIKDTHSGVVVGLTTWGKGLVQEIIPLNDDSAIALTTAHYFTPNGSDINLKGVTPDVTSGHVVQEPEEDTAAAETAYTAEKDRVDAEQLKDALDVLRKRMASEGAVAMKAGGGR